MKTLLAALAAVALASAASAQTTHNITVGPVFGYSNTDLTVQLGDTVNWNWSGGLLHNVESGVGGVPDGAFTSGAPAAGPKIFSVTFDSAFLAAHPMPQNVYNYYCIVHVSFGMTGIIRVETPYGCLNPAGSLTEVSGGPQIGQNWVVHLDNPIPGGQTPGSFGFLAIATQPAPGFPCGLPLPGFHMDPTAPFGELLISLSPPNPVLNVGPVVWPGTGSPAQFTMPVPANPMLVGLEIFAQGLILDTVGSNTFGPSSGLRVAIGA